MGAQITIGQDITGTTLVQFPPVNNKAVCRFQNTADCSISIAKAYGYWGNNYPSAKVKVVVYSDTAGPLPDALLGSSDEKVGITAAGWNEFNFSTPVVVASGAYVWIGVISDTMCNGAYNRNTGTIKYNADTYADGPSATFGAASTANYTYPIVGVSNDDGQLRFGRASVNSGGGAYQADREHGEPFVLGGSSAVLVSSISTYVKTTSVGAKSKAAIYTNAGGAPGALIAQTVEVTGAAANSWLTLTFSSPPTLTPGTYWLCFVSDTNLDTPTIGFLGSLQSDVSGLTEATAWPPSLAFSFSNSPVGIDIYASYALVVPSVGRPSLFVA